MSMIFSATRPSSCRSVPTGQSMGFVMLVPGGISTCGRVYGIGCTNGDHAIPRRAKIVHGQHARAAAVSNSTTLRVGCAGAGHRLEREQGVDELVERVGEHAAGLTRERDPHAVVSRERSRVRGRGRDALPSCAPPLRITTGLRARRRAGVSKRRRPSWARLDDTCRSPLRRPRDRTRAARSAPRPRSCPRSRRPSSRFRARARARMMSVPRPPLCEMRRRCRHPSDGDFGERHRARAECRAHAVRANQSRTTRARCRERSACKLAPSSDLCRIRRNHVCEAEMSVGAREYRRYLRGGHRDVCRNRPAAGVSAMLLLGRQTVDLGALGMYGVDLSLKPNSRMHRMNEFGDARRLGPRRRSQRRSTVRRTGRLGEDVAIGYCGSLGAHRVTRG